MEAISIVIADAQFLIRQGLRRLFEQQEDFYIAGEASDQKELMVLLKEHQPNVLVLDHDQPEHFHAEIIPSIKKVAKSTNILIISADNDKQVIYQVLEFGVNSFLTKTCDEEEIIDAVKATSKGEKFFCTKILDYLIERSFNRKEEDEADCAPTPLTPRELEIVRLVGKGLIAKEIANALNLSIHTVYTHRKKIMKKLELGSSSELVLYAINNGIVKNEN